MTAHTTPEQVNAYYDGIIDGITMYAHWKDGVQYVGTTGRQLSDAVARIEEQRKKDLSYL